MLHGQQSPNFLVISFASPCCAAGRSFREGGAMGGPGQRGVNFIGRRQTWGLMPHEWVFVKKEKDCTSGKGRVHSEKGSHLHSEEEKT
eukprot:1147900-Pelagomonas_calceolata.AAC.4